MYIESIDIKIPFSKRHPNETIRQIIRYDSGYIKDLFLKNEEIIFSDSCFDELKRLTLGHMDNWVSPKQESTNIFSHLKSYATPYLFDFNNEHIFILNKERQAKY